MSYAVMVIKGIGPLMADKLKKVGIRTTQKLLETAASAKGRKELAGTRRHHRRAGKRLALATQCPVAATIAAAIAIL